MKTPNTYSAHSMKLALFLLAASTLSACGGPMDVALDDKYQAYGGSDMHPITVVKGPVTMEVSSSHGTLQPGQINAVTGFANQAMQAGLTPLSIAAPSGGGASARVASEIASLVMQQGMPRNRLRFGTYQGRAGGPVRLSYVATYAKTKPCGQWSDATDTTENRMMPGHGCAVQANIAAMISNPETLVVPAAVDPSPAAPQVAGIDALYKGGATSAATTGSTSAAPAAPSP